MKNASGSDLSIVDFMPFYESAVAGSFDSFMQPVGCCPSPDCEILRSGGLLTAHSGDTIQPDPVILVVPLTCEGNGLAFALEKQP